MSQTHEKLISLTSFFEPFISIDNSLDFTAELRNCVIDSDLPQPQETERLVYGGTRYLKPNVTQC